MDHIAVGQDYSRNRQNLVTTDQSQTELSAEDGIHILDARTTIGPIINNEGKTAFAPYNVRNLSINKRLIRNTTVRAVALHRRLVELHPKVTASPTSTLRFYPNRSSWTVKRTQFPQRPAYATTFNGCSTRLSIPPKLSASANNISFGRSASALLAPRTRNETIPP
ncbi:hypothetical protein EDD22DRAFT_565632 [Suillus occidentalis]|nr:hypothetical protein EDD22DRAFT_565632 [Suillus occidentalis]